MYKCITLTYHHTSTHYRVNRCLPSPYLMQIPPRNIQMYMGAWDIQMCEGVQVYGGVQTWGYRCSLSLTTPMPASKIGTSIVWMWNMSIVLDVRDIYCSRTIGVKNVWMPTVCLNAPNTSVCLNAPLYICMFLGGTCIQCGDGGHLYIPYWVPGWWYVRVKHLYIVLSYWHALLPTVFLDYNR